MNAERCSAKTKIAIDNFFSLEGDTFSQKKRSLNAFVRYLRTNFSPAEVEEFVENLKTRTEYDNALKAEVIVHFQLDASTWNVLKSGDEPTICRVLKNWLFFKRIFNDVTVDNFVKEFLPLLSYKTTVKVINVIGKNLRHNEQLADDLFVKLEDKYGIKMAMIILPACSMELIKEKCSKYVLHLSSRSLLKIYKRDSRFLAYYFDLVNNINHKSINFDKYVQVLKYVAQTNLELFWQLYEEYKFSFSFGKRRTQKVLPNKEYVIKYGFVYQSQFNNRYILDITRKEGIYKEFLLKSYPSNIDDYLNSHLRQCANAYIVYMPRSQVFPLLNELFKQKYNEDLTNYLHFMDKEYLKYVTASDREFILDQLKEKEDWLHYYPTERSMPILKEKLKSANDHQTRRELIEYLYSTCEINNDAKTLLDILKLLYTRYKNDTSTLWNFVIKLMIWKNYNEFTEEHWEVLHNIIEYLTYSFTVNDHHFFERYFVWLIDNNKPYVELLDEYMKKRNEKQSLSTSYSFDKSLKHMKIFIEEIHKRLEGNHIDLYFNFLRLAINFHKRFPDEINILKYTYILDIAVERATSQQTGEEYYFIKNFNKNKSFNKYIKYYERRHGIWPGIVTYCLQNCPEELNNFKNLQTKMRWTKREFRQFFLCPHFMINYFNTYKRMAVDELQNEDINIHENLLHFLAYDQEFVNIIPKFGPPEDAKIEPQTDKIFVAKQRMIIKYIPKVPSPQNMQLVHKFCKGDYLKYALGALYKNVYASPEIFLLEFLQNVYNAAISVKKHALFLGRHLLPVKLYYDFLLAASNTEKNLSMRNILLKKTLEYLTENVDVLFFDLFVRNLDKIDKNDRDLYDCLLNYHKIPQIFKIKYITIIYDSIITNADEEIRKKRFQLIENLPDYLIDDLEVDFMKNYLLDATIGKTNFINKCLFETTGSKHDDIRIFIFNLIIDKLKECNSTNIKLTKDISNLISKICKEALDRENESIIRQLHEICKTNIPPHRFITSTLLLDFSKLLIVSQMNLDTFVNQISAHLLEFVKLYSNSIIALYASELKSLLSATTYINEFDFIEHFFKTNFVDDKTCLLAISFLPSQMPTGKNSCAKYLPLLDSLSKSEIPAVIAGLDVYVATAYD